jgi:hypothetical protein
MVTMKAFLAALALALLTAGCVSIGNVKISVMKYSGNCMPPVTTIPCCDSSAQPGFNVSVDGEPYQTDANGEIVLQLSKGSHLLSYRGCEAEEIRQNISVGDSSVSYRKTVVQGNAAFSEQYVTTRELIELNLPCCTA